MKLTSVTVDVINCTSAQKTLLLAADLGTRFTVSNLPSQAPASTMDFFIEGITYDIGPESFTVTFNTSAAAYANVWILDSASLSQLGTRPCSPTDGGLMAWTRPSLGSPVTTVTAALD